MAFDSITIGCSWIEGLNVHPSNGRLDSDVTADLTGASVEAWLYTPGGSQYAAVATSIDASARFVGLSLTPTETAAFSPQTGCTLDVRVTTDDGRVLPLTVKAVVSIVRRTIDA